MKHIDFYLDVIQKKSSSGTGGGGGITPTGTKTITTNGKHDVTQYAEADVQVPIPEAPSGKKVISVTENGVSTHDVTAFAQAEVNVAVPMPAEPAGEKTINITANGTTTEDVKTFATAKINVQVPNEGITPSGVKEITQNGVHDVAQFAQAKVNVPIPAEPTGEKTIDITQNGTSTEDVKSFASAKINVNVPVGVTPQGTKEISIAQNGETTEDVSSFKNVHIVTNVQSSGGGSGVPQEKYDALLMTFKQNNNQYDFANDDITSLRDFAFYGDRYLRNAILQNVTQIGENAFANCKALSTISADKLYNAGAKAFNASGLTQAVFPRLEVFRSQSFAWCASLVKVKCDKAKTIIDDAFNGCSKLKTIDMLGGGSISSPARNPLTYFESLVIRSTEKITSTDSLSWIPSTASIYVPDSMVEQYKTATNWSQKASQIKPLSEYKEV